MDWANVQDLPVRWTAERWVPGGPSDRVAIRVVRYYATDGKAMHILERRGGVPPDDWVAIIDPNTFEPKWWVPPASADNTQESNRKVATKMDTQEKRESTGIWFNRERHVTHAYIRDLTKIPRFWIDTPTFRFDSHADNPGWMLSCKQRRYNGRPGKLVIKLVHESDRVRSEVKIRPSNHNLHRVVETEADFIEVFGGDFMIETDVIARQTHQPLNAYPSERLLKELNDRGIELTTDVSAVPTIDSLSDEELLAELKRRSEARLDGWRPRRRVVDLSNVIDLEEIRQNLPVLDEERLARILAA
jgi:hypothetical protein